jgi:hypothetical protein
MGVACTRDFPRMSMISLGRMINKSAELRELSINLECWRGINSSDFEMFVGELE